MGAPDMSVQGSLGKEWTGSPPRACWLTLGHPTPPLLGISQQPEPGIQGQPPDSIVGHCPSSVMRGRGASGPDGGASIPVAQLHRGEGEGVRQITRRFLCGTVSLCIFFGGGTRLTVIGQPKASPMVTAFAPSKSELDTKKATLVCLRLLPKHYERGLDQEWLPRDPGGDDQPPSPPG
ncbi:uncharacterized protein LOC100935594 [Sarcophilus harrisii]|uniref:uncharacterized protein LOC100935594 n=1 Tax=Sarcophilus harrisii TaxID=9305 RepID=UPI001301EEFE|nr:uncharacterized protein LOC100935594 [Sarcophilus harrisii]